MAEGNATILGYDFSSEQLGCSKLVSVTKGQENYSGRHFGAEKLPSFLQLEGAVYKRLRAHPHTNILAPISTIEEASSCGVLYPPVDVDLHSYCRLRKGLPEREAKTIFHSILSAVHHCHKYRIVLRDIRLGKIFFKPGSRSDVVLGDLDGAQIVDGESPFFSDRKGSPAFVSPEVLVSPSYDGAAADMWALGVVLYLLLTGNYPFHDSHPASLLHKLQQGHSAVFFPPSMSEAARDILRSLLVREPHLRLTATQLLSDPWFTRSVSCRPAAAEADSVPTSIPSVSPHPSTSPSSSRKRQFEA